MGSRGKKFARKDSTVRCLCNMTRYVLFSTVILLTREITHADFISPSPGLYQSTDGQAISILSTAEGAQGIFFFRADKPIGIQEFNAETLPLDAGSHIFVGFDPKQSPPYNILRLGATTYKIRGNLTVWLDEQGKTRVDIDNSNPYLTFIHSSDDKHAESIVGFYGGTEVIRGSGEMSAILAANQLNPRIASVIKPYKRGKGTLMLNNRPVHRNRIGLAIHRDHICLSPDTLLITESQMNVVRKQGSAHEKAKRLQASLQANIKNSPIQGQLILRAFSEGNQNEVIALDISTKDVTRIAPLKKEVEFNGQRHPACMISPML